MAKKVIVFQKGDKKGHVYEGSYDAGITGHNGLVITELVPDVGNKNGGNPVPVVRSIYNESAWKQVVIDAKGD